MSKQGTWEYRVRRVDNNMLINEPLLGQSDKTGNIESMVNDLAAEGWELMPMALQTAIGNAVLVFRRPKEEEGGVYMERL